MEFETNLRSEGHRSGHCLAILFINFLVKYSVKYSKKVILNYSLMWLDIALSINSIPRCGQERRTNGHAGRSIQ